MKSDRFSRHLHKHIKAEQIGLTDTDRRVGMDPTVQGEVAPKLDGIKAGQGDLNGLALFEAATSPPVVAQAVAPPDPPITTSSDLDYSCLKSVPIFKGLSGRSLAALRGMMDHCEFQPGQEINGQTDGRFHIVLSGEVDLYASDGNGGEIRIGRAAPGEFFGEICLLSQEPCAIKIKTTEGATTLALDREEFAQFINRYPKAALSVISSLATQISDFDKLLRQSSSKNVTKLDAEQRGFGERVADAFAEFIGSWKFIIGQTAIIGAWITLNAAAFAFHWDPYPFIFLNLALSCQAAFAAPIIMMSQNRQAQRDRIAAEIDHRVNLSAETNVGELLERVKKLERKIHDTPAARRALDETISSSRREGS